MNQRQRDLSYRLEAVESVCKQDEQESQICQESINLWEQQHSMNIIGSQIKLVGNILGIFVLGIIIYFVFLKYKYKKEKIEKLLK